MKLPIISLIVSVCLFPTLGHAEPIRLTLEWVELDSIQSAGLVKALHGTVFEESSHPIFVDLENSKHKRVLITHVQQIEPGNNAEHRTQVNGTKFDLSLTVSHATAGLYEVGVKTSLQQAGELFDSLTPATLTALQWKKIPVLSVSTRIQLSHGNSCVVSGMMRRDDDGEKIQVLIISVVETWKSSLAVDLNESSCESAKEGPLAARESTCMDAESRDSPFFAHRFLPIGFN